MKLYRSQHSGKLNKKVVEELKSKPVKFLIKGFIIGCIIANLPLVHGQTIYNYTQDLESTYINQDNIYNYEQIINNTVTMIEKLELSNPDDIFFLITFFIHDGFFSINEEYKYQIQNNWDIRGYEGMDIVKGYGVCRHEAEFLNRILNECGYDATTVVNYAYSNGDSTGIWENGNHLVVVLKEENGFKVYDPTNFNVGVSNDGLTINLEDGLNLDLKPVASYLKGQTDFKKTFELFSILNHDIVSLNRSNLTSIEARNFSSVIEECRNRNLPFIEDICHRQEVKYGWNSFSK